MKSDMHSWRPLASPTGGKADLHHGAMITLVALIAGKERVTISHVVCREPDLRHRRSIPISRTLWRTTRVLPFGRAKQATSQSVPEEALRVRMRIRRHVSFPLIGTPEYIASRLHAPSGGYDTIVYLPVL